MPRMAIAREQLTDVQETVIVILAVILFVVLLVLADNLRLRIWSPHSAASSSPHSIAAPMPSR